MTEHKCPECKGEMKLLFQNNYYCPQDCDKPEVLAERKRKAEEAAAVAPMYNFTVGQVWKWSGQSPNYVWNGQTVPSPGPTSPLATLVDYYKRVYTAKSLEDLAARPPISFAELYTERAKLRRMTDEMSYPRVWVYQGEMPRAVPTIH